MFSRHSKVGIFTLALAAASIAAVPALMASHSAMARDSDRDHGRRRHLAWGHDRHHQDRHHHGRGDGDHRGDHQPPVVTPPPVTPPTTPPPDHPPA